MSQRKNCFKDEFSSIKKRFFEKAISVQLKNFSAYKGWGFVGVDIATETSQRIRKNREIILGFDHPWPEERFFPTDTGGGEIFYNKPKTIANDVLIFVLIANPVASAGETFVMALREMENVVFVGSNTSGGWNVGNYCFFTLPNSGFFPIGVYLIFSTGPFSNWREGVCFGPLGWGPGSTG